MLRRFAQNAFLVICSLSLSLLAADFVVRYALFTPEDRALGARKLFDEHQSPYIQRQMADVRSEKCSWSDTIVAHPYLGWVNKARGECHQPYVNSRGFPGRDIPFEKDSDHFTILVVGGSVASQLAAGKGNGGIWLEQILNRDYRSPNGKPFAIVSGAFGAWKFPTQNIATVLFGNRVDAVVAIDGFNEALNDPMDFPDIFLAVRLSREGEENSHWINFRTLRRWRNFCVRTPLLNRSYMAVAIMRWQVSRVEKAAAEARLASPYGDYYFPSSYSLERRRQWNTEQLKYYIRLLAGQARALKLKFAHFMQPIPDYKKPLTENEKRNLKAVTKDRYLPMLKANAELAKEGVATFSLAGVFDGHEEELYADEIHCAFDQEGVDSPGYRIMSEEIARVLGKQWKLRRK